jgi:serine/threonine protein kinase
MQAPIPNGTILRNRYRLLSILGQGGFGRTYLAEDQGRFQELCAMKEFMPPQSGMYALEKSKELFQREAQILYQIRHPQIPQFRESFEHDQRLFLVQDYVEGKTYRTLLEERKSQGFAFSEPEVTQLIQQVLPVLIYLHSKGIIHRDIAPDNIILRERDQLPVLIDFGVVKEIATRLQGQETAQQTTVGKLGYAPTEQMQTGQAYPSSDLYALAVTAIVLLTGREPQDLLNGSTMEWYWQRLITVSPGFAQVLNRMLSHRSNDRFQSAVEVMQALSNPSATLPPTYTAPPTPTIAPVTPTNVQTVAVGRRAAESTYVPDRGERDTSERSSLWDDPWAIGAIGTGLVLLTGIGSWTLFRRVLEPQPLPTVTPTETIVATPSTPKPTPTATLTPTPTPTEAVTYSQKMDLAPGKSDFRKGTLLANQTLNIVIPGQQGDRLRVALKDKEGVLFTVLAPNNEPVDDRAKRVPIWEGELPFTGDYTVQLKTTQGLAKGDFNLDVSRQAAVAPPSPSPSPVTTPSPDGKVTLQVERALAANETSKVLTGQINPSIVRRYLVNTQAGQTLSTKLTQGSAVLKIYYPDGRPIEDLDPKAVSWSGQLPKGGDYQIDVVTAQDTDFRLEITLGN